MRLMLRLENRSLHGDDVTPEYASDQRSFTIGRSEKADWTLLDKSRFVSTTHCKITYDEEAYWAEDLSANGLLINDEEVQKGARRVLSAGDLIEIGPYQLRVFFEQPSNIGSHPDLEQTVVVPLNPDGGLREIEDRTMFLGANQLASMHNITPVSVAAAKPAAAAAKSGRDAAHTGASRERFIEHFARGAGLDPEVLAGRQDDEFAQQLGEIFRTVVPGLTQLLAARSQMRALIHSTRQTVLKTNNNNPMKFIPETSTAMTALFGANKLEYLDAASSFTETIDELKAHEQAVFQAMQTALFRLLNELSPDAIEASTANSLLSGKGAYWTRYVKAWSERNEPHENGILDVFLHYFGEAYDERISRNRPGE
jgi:type VI secretion system protein ImpI